MTQFLPPNLLALFAPRDPIPFKPPTDKLPWEKQSKPYSGVSAFLGHFEDPKDTPPPTRVETKDERKERKRKERAEQVAYKLEQDLAMWDPPNDPNISGDPYKSLFVARVNFDTSESKLRREFDAYGPTKRISLVHDINSGKPRGYAFVEYEHERDMHSAYKHADGRKIDGRRVLVDVERGRTVKGWRPRRLGGGLGSTRKGGPDVNSKYSGRDEGRSSRSRSRERRRGSRSRSRERRRRSRSPRPERGDRPDRPDRPDRGGDRDRERRPRRSRSRERREKERDRKDEREDKDKADRGSRRRRSRSRGRSKSRDKKRSRRSRSRERRERKERKPDIKREDGPAGEGGEGDVRYEGQGQMDSEDMLQYSVKEEPRRGYMDEQEQAMNAQLQEQMLLAQQQMAAQQQAEQYAQAEAMANGGENGDED